LQTLKAWGTEVGIAVHGMDAVEQEGRVVSSTWLRAAVATGELKRVQALCGRPWSVLGTVERGQQLGRQLGFPTANVGYAVEVMPPAGVYACDLRVCGQPWMPALANLGYRPTVAAAGSLALEVHVLDWAGDLYGEQVEVRFLAHLRGEQKFESLEALKSQITADVQERRNLGNVHS
jgi:riboflavin kinase/FMN adenylyltransferase